MNVSTTYSPATMQRNESSTVARFSVAVLPGLHVGAVSANLGRTRKSTGGQGVTVSRAIGAACLMLGALVGVLAGGTAGATVGVVLAMAGFQALTRGGVAGVPYVLVALATTAGLGLNAWSHDLTATDLGLGRSTWLTGILWSLGIILVVGAVVGLAGRVPRLHHLFADDRVMDVPGVVSARRVLLDIPFGTVLVEEFAFRGVLLALVTVEVGAAWAVVVTSALFGLWHVVPALELHESHSAATGASWTTVLSAVLFTGFSGVVFGLLRVGTGSLFPPAALHWAANGSGVVVGWILHNRS